MPQIEGVGTQGGLRFPHIVRIHPEQPGHALVGNQRADVLEVMHRQPVEQRFDLGNTALVQIHLEQFEQGHGGPALGRGGPGCLRVHLIHQPLELGNGVALLPQIQQAQPRLEARFLSNRLVPGPRGQCLFAIIVQGLREDALGEERVAPLQQIVAHRLAAQSLQRLEADPARPGQRERPLGRQGNDLLEFERRQIVHLEKQAMAVTLGLDSQGARRQLLRVDGQFAHHFAVARNGQENRIF